MADFSAALGAMKRGLRVRREGWRDLNISFALVKDAAGVEGLVLVHSDKTNSKIETVHISNVLATDWEHIPE